ncbi:hypothetical protein M1N05_02335 [Dehalococcoidales bacterium]|nr:hypothetical protein [Dehalococcoidales bacterium]
MDVELVGAFLEQLEDGKVRVTETTSEAQKYVQGGLNIAFMQLGGGGGDATTRKETKTVYYELYNRLENALRTERKLIDLSASNKESVGVKENQFFLVHGTLTFIPVWSNWKSTGYVIGKINEWLATIQASEQEQQSLPRNHQLPDGTRSLILPDNRPVILVSPPQRGQVLPSLPDEPPEQLRAMIKPDEIRISIDIPPKRLKLVGSGFLENFGKELITALSSGAKQYQAHIMGLTTESCAEGMRFTPLAIFLAI